MPNSGSASQQAPVPGQSTPSFSQQQTSAIQQQQQQQPMFTAMQQQQSLSVPRAASAQSMSHAMQQVQQSQRPPTNSVPGPMFDLQQGQPTAGGQGLRPPTAPPQPGATAPSQLNPAPNRTPLQNQGQTPIPQGAQSVPSNVPARPSPNGIFNKISFDLNLKNFLDGQGITLEPRDLSIDTREVQLHELFSEVMKGGANAAVSF